MKTFEATTTISAPPQTVFDYVSDFTKHGDWAGHGLQVTKDSTARSRSGRRTRPLRSSSARNASTARSPNSNRAGSSAGTRRGRSAPCTTGSRWRLPRAERTSRRAQSSWTARSWPRRRAGGSRGTSRPGSGQMSRRSRRASSHRRTRASANSAKGPGVKLRQLDEPSGGAEHRRRPSTRRPRSLRTSPAFLRPRP